VKGTFSTGSFWTAAVPHAACPHKGIGDVHHCHPVLELNRLVWIMVAGDGNCKLFRKVPFL